MVIMIVFIVSLVFPNGVVLPVPTPSTLASIILIVLTFHIACVLFILVCF